MTASDDITEVQARVRAQAAKFEEMSRVTRRWKWICTALMLLSAALALAWSAWFLISVAVNWLWASLAEEMDPSTWQKRAACEEAHRKLLRQENLSQIQVWLMVQAEQQRELDRWNPWRNAWRTGVASGALYVWRLLSTHKLDRPATLSPSAPVPEKWAGNPWKGTKI